MVLSFDIFLLGPAPSPSPSWCESSFLRAHSISPFTKQLFPQPLKKLLTNSKNIFDTHCILTGILSNFYVQALICNGEGGIVLLLLTSLALVINAMVPLGKMCCIFLSKN